ncbi:uncharacterized protein LOC130695607 [Daphnia carinata]|uniref:uncharacterized protein LOC130695607 n=1 Tax=Daphnia carinata TaxID=120202 RepID=UPI00257BED2A|nr:uncharacterized protein LOC130695607 [Daphnia carinata]
MVAARLIERLNNIFENVDLEPERKIHELESKLIELKTRYETLEEMDQINVLRRVNPPDDSNLQQTPRLPSRATSRPKITLPRFNGDILQWQSFWQAFVAEIESDESLADINKFNYLLGQLDQKVLATVAGLTPSNENYEVLMDLLKERYGRKPVIAAYMRALYNLQKPEANLKTLRGFYEQVESYVHGLESLRKAPDTYGDLLVCILLDKLPGEVRKNVARQHDQDEFTLEQLRKALKEEIRVMEAGQVASLPTSLPSSKQPYSRQSTTMFNGVTNQKPPFQFPCVFCGADHPVSQCTTVSSVEERKRIVLQKRLCFNCLSAKHQRKDCQSRAVCRICRKQHHSSLHDSSKPIGVTATTVTNAHLQVTNSKAPHQLTIVAHKSTSSVNMVSYPYVFLKTAILKTRSAKCEVNANAMFDEGAQRSWITRDVARRLGLRTKAKEFLKTCGFANASSAPEFFDVVEFGIEVKDKTLVALRAIVIDYLVDPLDNKYRQNLKRLPHLRDLDLAHPYTGEDLFPVDLLIGADFYWGFIGGDKPVRGEGPTAINSKVGCLVSGPIESLRMQKPVQVMNLHIQSMESVEDLSFLWSLEMLGIFLHLEKYTARFPWKNEHPELAVNFTMVKNMTQATIKRLVRDGMLGVFATIIKDQLDRQFIEKVYWEQDKKGCHYIPYHYVRKESSTTPIRIVYNCSNKGWDSVSFNDCVETGAPLHNDQVHLLIRFRVHAIGFVADVEKAFHHIGLYEPDRDYLRWMWLSDPKDPNSSLDIYRFKVAPFGAKSSPFILNSVIMHHLSKNGSSVAIDMQRSVFVDNIISGCESKSEAESYFHKASSIMCSANLPLQSWGFSDHDVEKKLEVKGVIDTSRESKTLGLTWNRDTECLRVQVPNLSPVKRATKRDVLRGTAMFYDPLSPYAPLATSGKTLIQDLCIKGVKLDEELDSDHLERWKEIVSSIINATRREVMSVKRSYFGTASAVRDLHIFCDASRRAYRAVAYLVHQGEVSFVESKVRVTPIKSYQRKDDKELSIPESELMAAYLGTLVASIIISALEPLGSKLKVYLWSDSQIVHYWINKEEGHPRPFISNRVKKIRSSTGRMQLHGSMFN